MEIFTDAGFIALLQVIAIDLVLAGDNAIVIGMAAAGLPKEQRNRAIMIGIVAATVLRIIFALMTTWLMGIKGLLVFGGILLLWVCWKMWRELRAGHAEEKVNAEEALTDRDLDADGYVAQGGTRKTLRQAAMQIIVADVSMSLDNVLAVAGATLLNVTAKVIFQRPRPDELGAVLVEKGFSFPSGHTMANAAFGIALAYIFWRSPRTRWVSLVALAWAVAVGLSRNYLGVHYPTDVLVGFLTSLAWVTGLWFLMRKRWKALEQAPVHGQAAEHAQAARR